MMTLKGSVSSGATPIVAHSLVRPQLAGRRGYLYHLAVKPKGIGRKRVEKSMVALNAQSISKFHVFVKRHDTTASNF
ncbi:hypothetical protein ABXJ76_12265 [Methylobacter sp. G7]|uniref:hypothetical protein n=1 Tax=Methylobacter sp. G7 TaxID=3230117 RepID=UPI003D802A45